MEEQNKQLLEEIFEVNQEVKLTKQDEKYINDLIPYVNELMAEHGTDGSPRIKEYILDHLLKEKKTKVIEYLGLDFEEKIETQLENQLNDENFKTIESKEDENDFFKYYLMDETLNDIYYSWKGYVKKNDGNKEIFVKKRKAVIGNLNGEIESLYSILVDNFNKINFLSDKEDDEIADIIILSLDQTLDILLELPNEVCDTERTISIMSTIGLKLTNLIGFNKQNRDKILSALSESYQAKVTSGDRPRPASEE